MPALSDQSQADARQRTAHALRAELAKRRMTQEQLAAATGLSLATIGRAMRGRFRPETIVLIESKLETSLGHVPSADPDTADSAYGAYHRSSVAHLAGEYLCARRAFSRHDALVLYPMRLSWSQTPAGMAFEETNRVGRRDYSQSGFVHMPPGCAYLHLATIDRGSVRLITVSFAADTVIGTEPMRGSILTLFNPVASTHVPAVSPFVMFKLGARDRRGALHGVHAIDEPRVGFVREELHIAETLQAVCAFEVRSALSGGGLLEG